MLYEKEILDELRRLREANERIADALEHVKTQLQAWSAFDDFRKSALRTYESSGE